MQYAFYLYLLPSVRKPVSVLLIVSVYVYLAGCMSVCLSFLSLCLCVCLSVCLSVSLSLCLSVCLSFRLSICRSVFPIISLSTFLSVCWYFCLSICLPIQYNYHFCSSRYSASTGPEIVNLLRSPGIDYRPGGPVRQPYLTYIGIDFWSP